ncbi:MAG: selenide, water dikinase SelD [Bacteroidales bacterium]|jgi:selenide,water dikinase|nr:selenide, water dikinase SelD [Bacteroidales bacterium]MDD3273264.1 selenide, water dikinase SelD [Bacteroidales bacterium]MDD4057930.1 selenide, water dikinase SelD [Bacteroidales bacterium]
MREEVTRLTQFSPGAGCGCKIAPKDLEEILKGSVSGLDFPELLVGNGSKDDAAVYDLGDGRAIVSTTDFFTPIVDNPRDFGRIAATNAISDIYAMGGSPLMAIAILGWPLDKLPGSLAADVVSGAREVCDNAGIPLAGGHSISISDPIFGLAVTGIVDKERLKKNSGAKEGSILFLTKPIGIGLVTTAEKFGLAKERDKAVALNLMTTLNTPGVAVSKLSEVTALTDITGFGLMGHAIEMAEGSNLTAEIEYSRVPRIDGVPFYIEKECIPGGTFRNFTSYGDKIASITEEQKMLLCDPQTSGGLLIAVLPEGVAELENVAQREGFPLHKIGRLKKRTGDFYVEII